jgi:hypothetical protein
MIYVKFNGVWQGNFITLGEAKQYGEFELSKVIKSGKTKRRT